MNRFLLFEIKAQFPLTIRDMMDAKRASAQKRGLPVPEWSDEKDFLKDPKANPAVAWPMHLFDCCPISDGASCMLLVAEEMAKNFTDDPIYVAGIGQGSGRGFHASPDLTYFEATRYAAQEAYGMSGLQPEDVQFSEVHDCFSIAELVHIEDLGFFKPGEGYKAVADGATRLDGPKPINTSGGLKCKGHPVGATGARIMVTLMHAMKHHGKSLGLATLCGGGGVSMACAIEMM